MKDYFSKPLGCLFTYCLGSRWWNADLPDKNGTGALSMIAIFEVHEGGPQGFLKEVEEICLLLVQLGANGLLHLICDYYENFDETSGELNMYLHWSERAGFVRDEFLESFKANGLTITEKNGGGLTIEINLDDEKDSIFGGHSCYYHLGYNLEEERVWVEKGGIEIFG